FDDQDALTGAQREAAAHDEQVVLLFREDETATRLARDFLADDEAAHRRGEHGVVGEGAELLLEQCAEPLDRRHILANLRALEKMPAVQPRTEHEMPAKQRLGAHKYVGDLLLNCVHYPKKLWQSPGEWKSFFRDVNPALDRPALED